jgi:ABC-type antimicrobial peptide transport system permease subunit
MAADVLADVRYSLRSLARTPVWTAALVLTIALGIGSSASVQGFVRGVLTTDLPIFAIERVVTVFATDESGASGPVSVEVFGALHNRRDVFESVGAIYESQERVSIGPRSTLMSVGTYTPDIAAVFPLPSHAGVTLSHRVRFAHFPASVEPSGGMLHIDGATTRITGAMPYWLEGLYRGRAIDVWRPLDGADGRGEQRQAWVVGRLRPGVSVEDAQAAIDEIATADTAISVLPYSGQTPETASGMLRVGALLQLAAAAVFLIGCANVAAFVLARSWARARETAVRVAIGARRRQLLRQLLIDSAVISILGGVAGFIFASWMADIVPLMFFDQDAERLVFSPDARGIVATSLLSIAITLACGLAPLFETRDDEPAAVLQREVAGPSKAMTRVNTGLLLLQMTGCSLLVITTGLLLQGFRAALDTKAGRRLGNPVLVTMEALPSPSPDPGRKYFADAVASVASVASVSTASETVWAARLPGVRAAWQWVRFDPAASERREMAMPIELLDAGALEHIALPPVSGRLFGAFDAVECGTIVLNEPAAQAMFSGHPVGRVIDTPAGRPLEVIGVARPKDPREATLPKAYAHPSSAPLGVNGEVMVLAPPAGELDSVLLDINIVSPNYFDAMGLTLTAGQLFDGRGRGCRIGVVNEEAAARYFGGNAIGGAVIDAAGRRTEIVGVVRSTSLRAGQRLAEPAMFLPFTQDFLPRMTAVLATPNVNDVTLEAIRQRIAAVPGGRADRLVVTTFDDHLSNTALATERIAATLVGTFAVMAIVLGSLGLYGLMADAARRRQREFAMRLALGAQAWRVIRLVIADGLRLVGLGAAAGMLLSVLVAQRLAAIVPAAGWPSPVLWIAPLALLAGAVAIASVIPVRRALSADLLSLMRDM